MHQWSLQVSIGICNNFFLLKWTFYIYIYTSDFYGNPIKNAKQDVMLARVRQKVKLAMTLSIINSCLQVMSSSNFFHCDLLIGVWRNIYHCPACRTTLVATRFRVAVICPIIQVPHCIRVFCYFVWFVFINHIFQFHYELCTYCNILDIYLS